MSNTNENTIASWLPLFDGFYGSYFDSNDAIDWESEFEYFESEDYEDGKFKGMNIAVDDCDWDNEGYKKDITKRFTTVIGTLLKEKHFITDIKNSVVESPKYYNFSNDSINCDFVLNDLNSDNISGFINNHTEEFSEYLKEKYNSCDGFISSHSNRFGDWQYHTKNFTFISEDFQIEDYSHVFGSVLQFIALMLLYEEGIDEISLYLYEQTTTDFWGAKYLSLNEEKVIENREE